MPRGGDQKKEEREWDEVEFEKQTELAGESEIEQDKGNGEDEADDSLGEEVEGSDGGEGEAGEESGLCRLKGSSCFGGVEFIRVLRLPFDSPSTSSGSLRVAQDDSTLSFVDDAVFLSGYEL